MAKGRMPEEVGKEAAERRSARCAMTVRREQLLMSSTRCKFVLFGRCRVSFGVSFPTKTPTTRPEGDPEAFEGRGGNNTTVPFALKLCNRNFSRTAGRTPIFDVRIVIYDRAMLPAVLTASVMSALNSIPSCPFRALQVSFQGVFSKTTTKNAVQKHSNRGGRVKPKTNLQTRYNYSKL